MYEVVNILMICSAVSKHADRHAEFGHSRPSGVKVWVSIKIGSAEPRALSPRTCLPRWVIMPNLVALGQTVSAYEEVPKIGSDGPQPP